MVLVAVGAQPAAAVAVCPVLPTVVDHNYTSTVGQQVKFPAPELLKGATPTVGLQVETLLSDRTQSDTSSFTSGATIAYPTRTGAFTYTPDPSPANVWSGNDSFGYNVIDACGNEASASVNILVKPVFVADITYTAMKNTPLSVPVGAGFLAHDKGVNPASMFYNNGAHGTVDDSGNSDGSFVYTPNPGFVGDDAFGFTVDDINGDNTYAGTVHIHVVAAPGAPTGVVAKAGASSASITWITPPSNGSAIKSYTVIASPGGKTVTAATRPIVVKGLAKGVTYTFRVRARNAIGTGSLSAPSNPVTIVKALSVPRAGYWMVAGNAKVYGFGDATAFRSSAQSAVAIATRRDGSGYWTTDAVGRVSHYGAAADHGGSPALHAGESVSTISATPSGNGYWLFTNRGRAFAFGDARFLGDMTGQVLNGPVIASVATPTGLGYYMVGSDGGVFSFGDARFHGSTGGIHLNKPVVGISPTSDNRGYWLVASDGGVFAFNALFRGSMGGTALAKPVNGLVGYGNGYLMVASDGGVFAFSDKAFLGSLASNPPAAPVVGIAAFATP